MPLMSQRQLDLDIRADRTVGSREAAEEHVCRANSARCVRRSRTATFEKLRAAVCDSTPDDAFVASIDDTPKPRAHVDRHDVERQRATEPAWSGIALFAWGDEREASDVAW